MEEEQSPNAHQFVFDFILQKEKILQDCMMGIISTICWGVSPFDTVNSSLHKLVLTFLNPCAFVSSVSVVQGWIPEQTPTRAEAEHLIVFSEGLLIKPDPVWKSTAELSLLLILEHNRSAVRNC